MYLSQTLLNRFPTIENIENATKSCKIGSFLRFLENIEKSQDLGYVCMYVYFYSLKKHVHMN
jgi:hypothetical protein